jgi:hypothetical protein
MPAGQRLSRFNISKIILPLCANSAFRLVMFFSAAQFKFSPRIKAQTEGSVVYYSSSFLIKSAALQDMALHVSKVVTITREKKSKIFSRIELPETT